MIPKIVHYCWLSGDPVPDNLSKCMESWKRMLPDYEFMLWDKSRFDINSVAWVKEAYEIRSMLSRPTTSDYMPSIITAVSIWIWMSRFEKVLIRFFNNGYILGYEKENCIEAGIFGAEQGADWLKPCLEYYVGRHFIKSNGEFDTLPLPRIMFAVMQPYLPSLNIFPNEYLTAKSFETGIVHCTDKTYTIHHFAGSWFGKKQKLYRSVEKILGKNITQIISKAWKKIR